MAEFCALISSLADVPILQHFAVTGSVNQFGEVQPIGGANEKIEGFFDACELIGSDAKQAVIIPESNVANLMLSQKVINAVKKKRFSIYAVKHVNEALELLTGMKPGTLIEGKYEVASIFGKVHEKMASLRQKDEEKSSNENDKTD
jgi:predicted ATP-dependent protease